MGLDTSARFPFPLRRAPAEQRQPGHQKGRKTRNSPLPQPHQNILERIPFARERGHLPPARLFVISGPVARAERVAHHVLAGGGGRDLGFGGQAADNGDFREARRGGGGKGSERGGGEGAEEGGENWAEGRHGGCWVWVVGCGWLGLAMREWTGGM